MGFIFQGHACVSEVMDAYLMLVLIVNNINLKFSKNVITYDQYGTMLIITPDVVRLGRLQCMEVISTEGLSKRHDCLTQNDQNDTSLCHLDHFVFVGGQSSLCILNILTYLQ